MATVHAAKVENSVVTNVIKADSAAMPAGHIECPAGTAIGDAYNGTIFTAPAIDPVVPTQADFEQAVQAHLDARAHTYGFDNIFTGVSYADEPAVPKFQAEGKALRTWRSLVWAECYDILLDVEAGTTTLNTTQDLIDLLPVFVDPVYV